MYNHVATHKRRKAQGSQRRALLNQLTVIQMVKKFFVFIKHEFSSPCLKKPAIRAYPQKIPPN
jgi:hypothetical protein